MRWNLSRKLKVCCSKGADALPTADRAAEATSIRLDLRCDSACHDPRKTGLPPKQGGDKAQAGSDGRQDKATDNRAPDTGPPLPGQHPSLQLVQVPAHPASPSSLAIHIGRGSGWGR